jgi:hypothetical protein
MRFLTMSLAAAVAICAISATADAADCVKVEAQGEAVTHDIAELFATNGLKNIIYGKGRVGKGPVHTTCVDGSALTTCRAWQTACTATEPHACLGAWLCLPL